MNKNIKKEDELIMNKGDIIINKRGLADIIEGNDAIDPSNYLTFIDGVILTNHIYKQILQKHLTDKDGIPEKDSKGFTYIGIIEDDIQTYIYCKLLEQSYFKTRGYQLMHQFGINL